MFTDRNVRWDWQKPVGICYNVDMDKETCPDCQSAAATNRAGHNISGSQRWFCRACHRHFTPVPNDIGHTAETKRLALSMLSEGMSQRAAARVVGVSHTSVADWRKADQQTVPAQVNDLAPTEIVEVDELFSFVAKKKNQST